MLRSLSKNKRATQIVAVRLLGPSFFQRAETTTSLAVFEEKRKKIEELLKKELPKPYDGPERDLVNFPRRKRAEFAGKVRMGFIPDEWFQFFYKKTGVTGPYVFGTGLLTFLLSKEFYVIEHEFSTGCAIFLLAYIAIKKFGPAAKEFSSKLVKEEEQTYYKKKEEYMKNVEKAIENEKKSLWQAEGQKILMNAKRENVLMQLEIEYRRRMMNVYEQTKRRLDYHLELYNTKKKLEQKHMVDWIVNSVVKSITPDQEKEALKKCIEDLNTLSLKVQ